MYVKYFRSSKLIKNTLSFCPGGCIVSYSNFHSQTLCSGISDKYIHVNIHR